LFKMKKRAEKNRVGILPTSKVKKILNTGFLLSVGLASVAKENLEKISGKLVNKGRLNEKQGRELVNDLVKRSKKERNRVLSLLRK